MKVNESKYSLVKLNELPLVKKHNNQKTHKSKEHCSGKCLFLCQLENIFNTVCVSTFGKNRK